MPIKGYPPLQQVDEPRLGERFWFGQIPGGPQLLIVPRPYASKTIIQVAVPFGSCDLTFRTGPTLVTAAPGTAHLLEHLTAMTLKTELDSRPEQLGASLHAYTTWRRTVYSLVASDGVVELLPGWLSCLGQPARFTADDLVREQRIIAHEIRGNEQSAENRCRQAMLQCLYHQHPIRHSVTGTVEDVQTTTLEALRQIYAAFYCPSHMLVMAMGPIEPEWMVETVAANLTCAPAPRTGVDRVIPAEPHTIRERRRTERLPVASPLWRLAFKEHDLGQTGLPLLRRELLTSLALETLTAPGAPLRHSSAAGLDVAAFHADYMSESDFGYSFFAGSSHAPDELEACVLDGIEQARTTGLDPDAFALVKRNRITRLLRYLENPERASSLLLSYALRGIYLHDYLPMVQSLTVAEANVRLREHLDPRYAVTSLVVPPA